MSRPVTHAFRHGQRTEPATWRGSCASGAVSLAWRLRLTAFYGSDSCPPGHHGVAALREPAKAGPAGAGTHPALLPHNRSICGHPGSDVQRPPTLAPRPKGSVACNKQAGHRAWGVVAHAEMVEARAHGEVIESTFPPPRQLPQHELLSRELCHGPGTWLGDDVGCQRAGSRERALEHRVAGAASQAKVALFECRRRLRPVWMHKSPRHFECRPGPLS